MFSPVTCLAGVRVHGVPWGGSLGNRWLKAGVWRLKLGVGLIHSRPCHPRGRGKNERFHRSLKEEGGLSARLLAIRAEAWAALPKLASLRSNGALIPA